MIAVVTGGSGFIGRNLIQRLLSDGYDVRCLVRPGGGEPPRGVVVRRVALGDPRAAGVADALDGADAVFHLAGATRALRTRDFYTANVIPTRNLLDALAATRSPARFVYVSSQAAAGPASSADRPVVETDPPVPVEPYGRSKLAAERIVESFAGRLATTIVRPAAVFGPFDRDFLALFRMAARGIVLYPGVANHMVSLVSAADVVEGLMAAVSSRRAVHRTYFLTGGEPVTWKALGGMIGNAMGRELMHLNVPAPFIEAAAVVGHLWGRVTGTLPLASRSKAALARSAYWICSGRRAADELGVRDARSLPDAIADTYLWYRQHGWLRGDRRPTAVPV